MNRAEKLITDCLYHVFNRGVEKRIIFTGDRDYRRFIDCAFHYLFSNQRYSEAVDETHKIRKGVTDAFREVASRRLQDEGFVRPVEIVAYCLMPNHLHLLVKQLVDGGISRYLHKIQTSFTNYFNLKYDRVGPLFQGAFKYKRVETEAQLLHLTRYIHRNPLELIDFSHGHKQSSSWEQLCHYPWSSLPCYLDQIEEPLFKELVLSSFPSPKHYQKFVTEAEGNEDKGDSVDGFTNLTIEPH